MKELEGYLFEYGKLYICNIIMYSLGCWAQKELTSINGQWMNSWLLALYLSISIAWIVKWWMMMLWNSVMGVWFGVYLSIIVW